MGPAKTPPRHLFSDKKNRFSKQGLQTLPRFSRQRITNSQILANFVWFQDSVPNLTKSQDSFFQSWAPMQIECFLTEINGPHSCQAGAGREWSPRDLIWGGFEESGNFFFLFSLFWWTETNNNHQHYNHTEWLTCCYCCLQHNSNSLEYEFYNEANLCWYFFLFLLSSRNLY